MLTVREAAAVVRELRETRGWTQQELAQRAFASRSFVADVEAGKATVEASKLFDLFQALGYEVAMRDMSTGELRW
jgi:transcriptional regulator with XRE-family HTH domain